MGESYDINKEIEIKLDLGSFTNYLKLVGFLGQFDREECQLNAFFDTEDRLLANDGWALRMRTDESAGYVTLKSQTSEHELAAVRDELETVVDRQEAHDVVNLKRDIMRINAPTIAYVREQYGKDLSLARLVHFENHRQHKAFRFGDYTYDLEIDTTRFSDGTVDYELEVELTDEAQVVIVNDRLRKLFATLDIPFVPQEKSKFARALARAEVF
jgi:uncharacterized protein YjbK